MDTSEESTAGGIFLGGIIAIGLGVIFFFFATMKWGDLHFEHSSDAVSRAEAEGPQIALSNGGVIHEKGYKVLLGPIQTKANWPERMQGFAPAFVMEAPNQKPFNLTCIMLDKHGALIGGGGSANLTYASGQLVGFDYVVARPANVRCRVRP